MFGLFKRLFRKVTSSSFKDKYGVDLLPVNLANAITPELNIIFVRADKGLMHHNLKEVLLGKNILDCTIYGFVCYRDLSLLSEIGDAERTGTFLFKCLESHAELRATCSMVPHTGVREYRGKNLTLVYTFKVKEVHGMSHHE